MKYIYFIINKITGERYVGQTTNYIRRKGEHLTKLENGTHPNKKLQYKYNYYGIENFYFEKMEYSNITKEELDEKEIYYIKHYDSINNGYNLTTGGTGGNTRGKISFEQFCFIYFGNRKHKGLMNRTAKYLGIDSSIVSHIVNNKSYEVFRYESYSLSPKVKENIIKNFEEKLDIVNNPPKPIRKTLNKLETLKIMCVVSSYGRGIENLILKHFNLSKGFIFHLMTGNGRVEAKLKYSKMSEKQILNVGNYYFKKWDLVHYSNKKIPTSCYTNLNDKYIKNA